jgi:hypothetical protein
MEMTPTEEAHTAETQLRGTIKYLPPDPFQVRAVEANIVHLQKLGKIDFDEFIAWVSQTNPVWLPHIPLPPRPAPWHKALARRTLQYLLFKLG